MELSSLVWCGAITRLLSNGQRRPLAKAGIDYDYDASSRRNARFWEKHGLDVPA